MTDKSSQGLDRDNLFLLMEAYRNTFESNATLLEQQKALIDSYKQLIEEQKNTTGSLKELVSKLDTCAREIHDYRTEISVQSIEMRNSMKSDLSGIKNKIHVVWIGVGAIVVPLIGLTIKMISELSILNQIALYFNKLG